MEQKNLSDVGSGLGSALLHSLGLYVHVPFCRVRCPFCPFYVQVHRQRHVRSFLNTLKRELRLYSGLTVFQEVPVTSVYIGGGTPTTLSISELGELLSWIQEGFSLTVDAEMSIEVHPGTVSGHDLKELHTAGFNRVSLGIQSFDGDELKRLGGRIFKEETGVTVADARNAGFQNINLDLMYGWSGHTLGVWQQTLEKAIDSSPEHLSCYSFTVEEGTHFKREISRGLVEMPVEESQLLLEEEAITRLEKSGYERYEVSNFSRTGYMCRHNMRYWQGKAYLGLGPSAQSYVGGVRFGNIANLQSYTQCLQDSHLPIERWEPLSATRVERENVVFGLRTIKGVLLSTLSATLQSDEEWNRGIQWVQQNGLLKVEDGHLRLTTYGFHHADTVAVALL